MTVGAVARNLVPESVSTDVSKFETTAQLFGGIAWSVGWLTVSADAALNPATVDGIEQQPLVLGVRAGSVRYAVRLSASIDNERRGDAVAYGADLSIGPLHLGARVAELDNAQAHVQLSYGF